MTSIVPYGSLWQGFATKTGDCVYMCESGYHAALNKSSLRATAERLEALAREEDPDRFALQAPESDKVYAAARARGGSECKFTVRRSRRPRASALRAACRRHCAYAAVTRLRGFMS